MKIKRTIVDLNRVQLLAILESTDGPIEIERCESPYRHIYVVDRTLKTEGRCLHISVKGKVRVCEGTLILSHG